MDSRGGLPRCAGQAGAVRHHPPLPRLLQPEIAGPVADIGRNPRNRRPRSATRAGTRNRWRAGRRFKELGDGKGLDDVDVTEPEKFIVNSRVEKEPESGLSDEFDDEVSKHG